jgi:magnesium-transporting ATPase (P-type)
MAQNALRVLAFAFRQFDPKNSPENSAQAESDLVFCGLVGMIDPPRGEVAQAVKQCHTAGIRIVVITGDYGITAEAIAKELGITKGKKAQVLTGSEVEKLDDQDLKTILHQTTQPVIFARSLPAQKMRIVRLLQNQGEIVAMTGDGVNDAPALKKADIGIAMGITGTEVSKEAAVMVLTNDSFASIVKAVEEGRRIYDNLQKFIWFMFACNIGELFVVFAAIIFQFPLPLTAILILAVDLGTDILPAIALGVDTPEKGLMQRKPRDPESKVMNKRFVKYFLLVGSTIGITVTLAFLLTIYNDGWNYAQGPNDNPWRHAQTVAFASLVFVQLLNTYSARSEKRSVFNQPFFDNHFLTISIFSSVLLALMMIYLPFFNRVLKTSPLTAFDWLVVTVATIIPFIVIEIRKAILRKREGLI